MKVNISYISPTKYDGFTNLSSFGGQDPDISYCDIKKIDEFVDNDEAELIQAIGVLNFFTINEVFVMLENWITKLQQKGKLVLTFSDFYEIARRIMMTIIENKEVNDILYGSQSTPFDIKRSAIPLQVIKNYLQSKNMKITKCRLESYNVLLECEKQ